MLNTTSRATRGAWPYDGPATSRPARIGLGYVGLPLLLAAAAAGYGTVGIDVDDDKVAALGEGRSYISDVADIDLERLDTALLTSRVDHAVLADVIVIAVPTPLHDGTPDLSIVTDAVRGIAEVLRPGQLVVLESTTWPGTTEEVVLPLLESSGLRSGTDFAVAYSPERVNPGSNTPLAEVRKVVGGCGETATNLAEQFYRRMIDNVHTVSSPRSAEMAKLIENLADGETIEEYRTRISEDVEQSSYRIAKQTGTDPVAFAYPFGAYGADRTNDPRIAAILDEEISARYEIAFHQDGQDEMTLVGCGDDALRLRRLEVQQWSGPELIQRIAEASARFDTSRRCRSD